MSDQKPAPSTGQFVRWHFGKKVVPGGKKKPFWMNRWLAHRCADLALPFELGIRAMGHTDG